MLTSIVFLAALALGLTGSLLIAARVAGDAHESIADTIERQLPHIQCAQCGFPGCRPYAEAIAEGRADINLCPPGGEQTVRRLAELLGREFKPVEEGLGTAALDTVARIVEPMCIGCNLCARACPVDAIVGIPQTMHTVIAADCTGCQLCLPPCPVDCIELVPRHA